MAKTFRKAWRIPVQQFDAIVVGEGNAALCAAFSAAEQGARAACSTFLKTAQHSV